MADNPLVSAIIVNYNYARFLDECIASVQSQTYSPIEIIVVDDGSTDDSREVLRKYENVARVILKENGGQASAFDAAVAVSKGEFVCLLDSDDTWTPGKVARVMEVFADKAEVEWVSHSLRIVDERLQPRGVMMTQSGLIRPDARLLAERRLSAGTSMSMRRSLAERVFPLQSSLFAGDAVLLARCVAAGAHGFALDEVLGVYRRHSLQRYAGDQDIVRLLRDHIVVTTEMARIVGIHAATPNFKHRSIIAYLEGEPWYGANRLGSMLAGIKTALSFAERPGLFARQTAALLYAWLAPDRWLRSWVGMKTFAAHDLAAPQAQR